MTFTVTSTHFSKRKILYYRTSGFRHVNFEKKTEIRQVNFENLKIFRVVHRFLVGNDDGVLGAAVVFDTLVWSDFIS